MRTRTILIALALAGAAASIGATAFASDTPEAPPPLAGIYAGDDNMGRYHMLAIGPLEGTKHPFWWGFESPSCEGTNSWYVTFGMVSQSGTATVPGRCLVDRRTLDRIETVDVSFEASHENEITAGLGPVTTYSLDRVCNGSAGEIVGSNGPNVLVGSAGDDIIHSLGGDDTVFAGGGNDIVCAGRGSDTVFGQGGIDLLIGEGRQDFLYGGLQGDALFGSGGTDVLSGQTHDDVLFGGVRNDRLSGGPGADWLWGGLGTDRLQGGLGYDRCFGGSERNCEV